jgi:hypothetical protein
LLYGPSYPGDLHNALSLQLIQNYQDIGAELTPPEMNKGKILGTEVTRDHEKRIVMVKIEGKNEDLEKRIPEITSKPRNVPMPTWGFLVRDY